MHTTRPFIVGGELASKPKNFGQKKPPAMPKGTAGEVLLDAHQLGTLVVSNPDLLGSIVSDAEVEAFKEI